MPWSARVALVLSVALWGCQPATVDELPLAARPDADAYAQPLVDAATRKKRAEVIRDRCRAVGINTGMLIAGIGEAETSLSHCNSEVGYGCPGPASPSCNNGPVLAGGADGPCSAQQGGLGMFQFDRGTYTDTLNHYGPKVLTFDGNVELAIEFMIDKVILSTYIANVSTRAEAIAWINNAGPGTADHPTWLKTVTHYYNGCTPTGCSVYSQRYAKYDTATKKVTTEFGSGFWDQVTPPPPPPPPPTCQALPSAGGLIEESDGCFAESGTAANWKSAAAGHANALRWTYTTDAATGDNVGVWKLNLAEGGRYLLEAYSPGASHAQSAKAAYEVMVAGAKTTVVVDQRTEGFQSLGTYELLAGDGQSVRLADNTGEPYAGQGTKLVFDALRVTPAGPVTQPDAGVDPGSDAGVDPTPWPETPRGQLAPKVDGGCSVAGAGPLGLWALGWLLLRRRRERPT